MANWKHDPDLINEGILMVNTLVNEIMRETYCDAVSVSTHRDFDGIRIHTVWYNKGYDGMDLNCMIQTPVIELIQARHDVLMSIIERIKIEFRNNTGQNPDDPTELG